MTDASTSAERNCSANGELDGGSSRRASSDTPAGIVVCSHTSQSACARIDSLVVVVAAAGERSSGAAGT